MKQQGRCGSAAFIHRLVRVAAGALALSAVPITDADAGTYDVWSCRTPQGTPAAIGDANYGWQAQTSSDTFVAASNRCADNGYFEGRFDAAQSRGAYVQYRFFAPPGTDISAYDLYWSGQARAGASGPVGDTHITRSDLYDPFYVVRHPGTGDFGDPASWSADANRVQESGLSVNYIEAGGGCGGNPGTCQADWMRFRVYRSVVTISDNSTPVVGSVTGDDLTSSTWRGTQTVSVNATDSGSGVYRLVAKVDGVDRPAGVISTAGGRCADVNPTNDKPYEFVQAQPCPTSTSGDVSIDTDTLSDGEHSIRLMVEDAAGNRATAWGPKTITIRNAPDSTAPPTVTGTVRAGEELTCNPGTFNPAPDSITFAWLVNGVVVDGATGSKYSVRSADVGKSITCRVTAVRSGHSTTVDSAPVSTTSSNQNQTTTSSATNTSSTNSTSTTTSSTSTSGSKVENPAGANGSGGLVTTARFTAASKRTRRIRYGQKITLSGQLRDAEGRPIVGATVDVYSRIARKGTVLRKVGTVVTDGDGVYRWVAPVGVSRSIRFAYRAVTDAAEYRDQVDVALQVRAKLTLKPRRSRVRSFGTMRLRGKLYGSGLPARGALIEIQYLDGHTWKTAAVRRTKKGVLRFDYRFKRTARGVFRFRALLRSQAGVPLATGKSKTVVVRVG